jgi:hypothetical protein
VSPPRRDRVLAIHRSTEHAQYKRSASPTARSSGHLSLHLNLRSLFSSICHLSFVMRFARLCSSEPGAVIEVNGDEEQDSFDHVERQVGAGESQQEPEWT